MKISNSFTQGKMNKDLDERLIPKGQYRDALNIEVNASEGAGIGAVENVKGNTLIGTYPYPSNENNLSVIGSIANQSTNDIFFLVTGSINDYVLQYNSENNQITTLLQDTKGRVLKFNSLNLITGINIIDNLLFWTDDLNPPRRLDVSNSYQTDAFTEDDISVIVKPPLYPPKIFLTDTTESGNLSGKENNIEDKFIQFSYRYKYENNEYSAMSPFSATAFFPKAFSYNYADAEFTSMVNNFNEVDVSFLTGESQVKEVQILFRDTLDNSVFVIERFNKSNKGWGDNAEETITFSNNKIFSLLPPDEVTRLFDNVPLQAKSQDIIGSRLIYGNYTQFFNIDTILDYQVEHNPTYISTNPKRTFKSNRDYEVGVAYLDQYGRMSTVLTSENNAVHIPIGSSKRSNSLRITLNNQAPTFATKYRLFIKQNKGVFYNIFPLYYYIDGVYRWFRISQSDVDKVKEGDYITVKVNNDTAVDTLEKMKVIEVSVQERDYLGNNELPGLYFKVKVDNTLLFDGSEIEEFFTETVGFAYSVEKPGSYSTAELFVGNIDEPVYYGSRTDDYARLTILNLAGSGYSKYKMLDSLETQECQRFKIYMDSSKHFSIYYFNGSSYERHEFYSQSIEIPANRQVSVLSMAGGTIGTSVACKFEFAHTSGYTTGDYWIINILPSNGRTFSGIGVESHIIEGNTNYLYGSKAILPGNSWSPTEGGDQTSFPQPGGTYTLDRPVESGARIRIRLKEEESYGEGSWQEWQEWVSPRRYANIQEWFWESGAHRTFKQFDNQSNDSGASNVFFRRGYNRRNRPGAGEASDINVNYISQNNDAYTNADRSTILAERPVYMFILTSNLTDSIPNYMHAEMEVIMQAGLNVFETEGKESLEDVFYEVPRTYNIENRKHQVTWKYTDFGYPYADTGFEGQTILGLPSGTEPTDTDLPVPFVAGETIYVNENSGATVFVADGYYTILSVIDPYNIIIDRPFEQSGPVTGGTVSYTPFDQDQTSTKPLKITLNPMDAVNTEFNAYSFGNGVESMVVRGDWNGRHLKYSPRASSTYEDYAQERVEEALTYSGVYRENTGINNFNEFNLSLANFKYLDKAFGSIQKIKSRDTDLVVFQENKVSKILYGKNLLSDAVGGGTVASIPEVLGTQVSFAGEYGISKNPESFAQWGNNMYFADEYRGAVCRLSNNGIFEISSFGMADWFKDLFRDQPGKRKMGGIDPFKGRYVIATRTISLPIEFEIGFEE